MKYLTRQLPIAAALMVGLSPWTAHADSVEINSWTTNEGDSGNYILTLDDNGGTGTWSIELTVDPWNADLLGLFVDLGNNDVGTVALSNVVTSPTSGLSVSVFATDTSSNSCGSGCNLSGLAPPVATPDDEWELVFKLGTTGSGEGALQTVNFDISGMGGLLVSDFALAGIRAQNLCAGDDVLPDGTSCTASDKSYSGTVVPLPAAAWLFGSALLGMVGIGARRGVKSKLSQNV